MGRHSELFARRPPAILCIVRRLFFFFALANQREQRIKRKGAGPSSDSLGADKVSKGLRQFSLRVCQKVEEKGCTTYNEVADELVNEFANEANTLLGEEVCVTCIICVGLLAVLLKTAAKKQKNIRRRVYDALNVLMAMDIIRREKKEIRWNGLPTSTTQESAQLQTIRTDLQARVHQKHRHYQELVLQYIVFRNLLKRNQAAPNKPDPNKIISLPFIIVNTHREARISCEMTPASTQFFFDFDVPFGIHDDIEILTRMGLNVCTPLELRQIVDPTMLKFMPPSAIAALNDPAAENSTQMLIFTLSSFVSLIWAPTAPFLFAPQRVTDDE